MNKEELESKFEDCFDANTRASEGGYGADTTSRMELWESFHPLISEFAKQQAIAFDIWKRNNLYTINVDLETYVRLIIDGDKATTKVDTFDDIYAQFIDQQNK